MTTSPGLDNPLWTFSLAVYGAPGVADECLALQERLGLDVNLLLLAAHAGAVEGVRFELRDIESAAKSVATWHGEIVRALRRARRALKPFSIADDNSRQAAVAALRASVKAAELESERIEQTMLWYWSSMHIAARQCGDRRQALTHNLRALMMFYGEAADQADPAITMPRLHQAAMAHAGSAL